MTPHVVLFARTVAVALMAAAQAAFWDETDHFVRTHDIDVPPFGPSGGF